MDDNEMPKAFAVDGELSTDAGPPQDGFDYLRQVRYEANRLANVVVAPVDPRAFAAKQTRFVRKEQGAERATATPGHRAWERSFLAAFETLRGSLEARAIRLGDSPKRFLPETAAAWPEYCMAHVPTADASAALDHVTATRLLEELAGVSDDEIALCAEWMVAALARIDEQVGSDTGALLRSLLRRCRRLSAARPSPSALLDMVVAIAGKFFGQEAPDD